MFGPWSTHANCLPRLALGLMGSLAIDRACPGAWEMPDGVLPSGPLSAGPSASPAPLLSTLLDAVDLEFYTLTTVGSVPWFPQTEITRDGEDAAQSGVIADNAVSGFRLELSGPAQVRFWWKASTEANTDLVLFLIDQNIVSGLSGEANWVEKSQYVPDGFHTLVWSYVKNGSGSRGADAVWVDRIRIERADATNEDRDSDGMADAWEREFFNSLGRDGRGDFDADGRSDRFEFDAGTNPTDATSFFAIALEADRRLRYGPVAEGHEYRVWWTPDIRANAWRLMNGLTATPDGADEVVALPGPEDAPFDAFPGQPQFFRVTVQ